jgi:transposase
MGTSRKKFVEKGFDEIAYKRYLQNHQSEYMRKKLRAIYLYSQGQSAVRIGKQLAVNQVSIRKYISQYIEFGFSVLCVPIKRPKKSMLTAEQSESFKQVLLQTRPCEVGLEGNIWTGKVMCEYLKNTYGVFYRKGIYDLLERLGLSHQKAHADYGNAKKEDQNAFLDDLKEVMMRADEKTAVVKFDEFSVSTKTSTYYGWAQKNTRPKVVTDEKK